MVFARGSRSVGDFACPGEVSGSVNRETASSPFRRFCLGTNLRHVAREWWSPCHASAADPRTAMRRSDQRVTQGVDLGAQYHQPRAPIVIATGHNPPRTKPRPVLWQWRGRCMRWQSLRHPCRGPHSGMRLRCGLLRRWGGVGLKSYQLQTGLPRCAARWSFTTLLPLKRQAQLGIQRAPLVWGRMTTGSRLCQGACCRPVIKR